MQGFSAKIIAEVAADSSETAAELFKLNPLPALFALLTDTSQHENQVNAVLALKAMARRVPGAKVAICNHMGQYLFNQLMVCEY